MTIKVFERYEEYCRLQPAWNEIVTRAAQTIEQVDVTSTFEWAAALWRNFLRAKEQNFVVVAESEGHVLGILPLYLSQKVIRHVPCRRLAPFAELYSVRGGFLPAASQRETLETLLAYLYHQIPAWDVFEFTLVDGSPEEGLFLDLARRREYRYEKTFVQSSPYIVLDGAWEGYFQTLSKSFRSHLRNHEKKLRAMGTICHKEYRMEAERESFLNAMIEIERDSWKEESGTSVTTNQYQEKFYRDFISIAAQNEWFSGHLLSLDDEPVAYIYGLRYRGVFFSLKTSYKERWREFSPGNLIRLFALQELYRTGVQLHDFTGACEPHKMRWTDKTYARSTYMVYNDTLKGHFVRLSDRVGRYVASWHPLTSKK